MSLPIGSASKLGTKPYRPGTLFCFGLGYTGVALARALIGEGWDVRASEREEAPHAAFATEGVQAYPFEAVGDGLKDVTHLLVTAPPMAGRGDPVLARYRNDIVSLAPNLTWVGYLSTTGVYGNRDGGWVDETSSLRPTSERATLRVAAEAAWRDIHETVGLPLNIFRLAGIYGPLRNALETVKAGRARRIIKPGQLFSRIHLDDLVAVLKASMAAPRPSAIYNICDNQAAPPQDVIEYACNLLGVALPPEEDFAAADLSPMARSFYADNKRVANRRIREELGIKLAYPNYRVGLNELAQLY